MSSKVEDEDYWASSERTGFSFDDDVPLLASSLIQSVQNTKRELRSEPTLFDNASLSRGVKPLENLVSKQSLVAILDERKKKTNEEIASNKQLSHWDVPTPSSTVRAITLGRPFSLHYYRSLELKSLLLEEAVKSKNGNAILCVVLFLKKTLSNKLFLRLIQFQPSAVPPYINYLMTRFEARTAVELLLALGQARDAALKDFQFSIQPQQNLDKRLYKLRALVRDHFSTPDAEDKLLVENFLRFVEWQTSNGGNKIELSGTVASALSYLLTNHWSEARALPLSPYTLSSLLGVSDRQLDWKALTARAAVEDWNSILELLLTKGWLRAKKLKTVITPERIVIELHKQRSPENIVSEFFTLVDTAEKQLDLAKKLAWHRAVIDTLVTMKDRQGLVIYQAALNPQSNDYLHAEAALKMLNIKWKN